WWKIALGTGIDAVRGEASGCSARLTGGSVLADPTCPPCWAACSAAGGCRGAAATVSPSRRSTSVPPLMTLNILPPELTVPLDRPNERIGAQRDDVDRGRMSPNGEILMEIFR